jgi:hypothetical protein
MAAKKKVTEKSTAKKVENLTQTDGMVKGETSVPSSLDQVWGDDGTSKYKTLNLDVYERVLSNMSKSDLKAEAVRTGLLPIDNMDQLRIRLIREFRAHVSSYKRPTGLKRESVDDPNLDPDVRKILSEGK